ncbi:MAG TPA: LLM class flavin-dependent oxidoreductase [Acidimicrobiales bacterium]|jgi:alkanesulfonate monooxygenase SsuD/methylene tetrahydromethanopterin reductase-like flavin-dependent oxidoreductase (luciferase family)|nr:LLM class flavin-dependent oxidoreductase [Acidimicrobiales bacterium]
MPVSDVPAPRPPFEPGSISLRLYPHNELPAPEVISELCAQAGLGLRHGFDGIMTSEHHGGFAGYLPNPLQMVTFILEENATGWAAACPLLLPLRPTALVAEEVAWLAARHPDRVGLGVAAGALALDFEAMGQPLASAVDRFTSELPRLVDMLRGADLRELKDDPALRQCADRPVPVLSAAASPGAARRAARSGAGILMEGMSPVERLAQICAGYDQAGGTGTKLLIRRVWLGRPDSDLVGRQRAVYDSYAGGSTGFGDDQTVSADDPAELAARLHRVLRASGADALNLRVHLPGMAPELVREQIARLGAEVVPPLRALVAG